jgi:hypothetical protein
MGGEREWGDGGGGWRQGRKCGCKAAQRNELGHVPEVQSLTQVAEAANMCEVVGVGWGGGACQG